MMVRWRTIAGLEAVLILTLLLAGYFWHAPVSPPQSPQEGLLSPRVYAGVLEPQSFLIVNYAPLKKSLEDYFAKKNYTVSVYVVNLRNGVSMGIREDERFVAVSLNKVPMALFVLRQIEKGVLSLDTKLPIEEQDMVAGASPFLQNRSSASVEELLERMLRESDNVAYRVLFRQVNTTDVWDLLNYLDFYGKDFNHVLATEPTSITPRVMYNLFMSLYLSTILQPEHSEYILSELAHSTFNISELAQLPPEVVIAQKYGTYQVPGAERYFHNCGIMYIGRMRAFYCVMTQGLEDQQARQVLGVVVNGIYRYTKESRQKWDELFKTEAVQ